MLLWVFWFCALPRIRIRDLLNQKPWHRPQSTENLMYLMRSIILFVETCSSRLVEHENYHSSFFTKEPSAVYKRPQIINSKNIMTTLNQNIHFQNNNLIPFPWASTLHFDSHLSALLHSLTRPIRRSPTDLLSSQPSDDYNLSTWSCQIIFNVNKSLGTSINLAPVLYSRDLSCLTPSYSWSRSIGRSGVEHR